MSDISENGFQMGEMWAKLTRFAIELTSISTEENLESFVAQQLKDLSGAELTWFSEYDPNEKVMTPRWIEAEPGVVKRVVKLIGKRIHEIEYPVTDSLYKTMTLEKTGVRKTLHEVSFGGIPKAVGAAIQTILKLDRFIGISYMIEGELYGTSVMAMKKDVPDPPRDILESFTNLAAVSIRRHRAESEMLKMKQSLELLNERLLDIHEGERAAFSGEIHYQLGQTTAALIMDAKLLLKKCDCESDEGKRLAGMVEQLTGMAEEIQGISNSLYPAMLDEIGLSATIEWYCNDFERKQGIRCSSRLEEIQSSNNRKNLALYRIMQEALNNVEQHSKADAADVKLFRNEDTLVLEIEDNGAGYDIKETGSPGSIGIFGMKERVKPYGGEVEISSRRNRGTTVRVRMPLD